jgi:thioredoxin reductase (NADPH)
MKTSVPGIFAAGDVVSENLAQIAVAVGDGAKAAVAIREYLQNL